jgi:branched-chain amino acid transport system substrate-binding protein
MDYQIAPVAADGMKEWLGAKSVAIIYDATTDYTVGIAETLKAEFEKDGITVPAYLPIQPGGTDYTSALTEATTAGADAVYVATYFPEGAVIARNVFALKMTQPCVLDYGAYDPGYITNAGSVEVAQACSLVGVPSPTDFPQGAGFVAAYDKAFSLTPGTWSPYVYDSVKLFAEAVVAAGGTDEAKLKAYLDAVKDWQGATGSVTIDAANGNREPATVVFLSVTAEGEFHVNHDWALAVGAPF